MTTKDLTVIPEEVVRVNAERVETPAAFPAPRRASASKTVREDYFKKKILSYAEAGLVAGVKASTIQSWICKGVNGVRLPVCSRRGPYRINIDTLRNFLEKKPV